jgi:hypothetical protein
LFGALILRGQLQTGDPIEHFCQLPSIRSDSPDRQYIACVDEFDDESGGPLTQLMLYRRKSSSGSGIGTFAGIGHFIELRWTNSETLEVVHDSSIAYKRGLNALDGRQPFGVEIKEVISPRSGGTVR